MSAPPATAAPTAARIPTVRNVDHFAYTVPDLDRAVDLFTRVLGAELLYRLGPVEEPDSDWMTRQLGVHPRASAHIAMLRFGPVSNLELFQYTAPEQRTEVPGFTDVGGHHIGIHVGDLDQALARLREEPGVRVLGEPQTQADGPTAGNRWIHVLTDGGLRLELRQVAAELPYERETPARLYRPAPQWSGPGLPTARGVDHVGYTVADLDEAVDFFTGPMGGELVHRSARSVDEALAARQFGVDRAFRIETAVIRLGPVTNLELSACAIEGQRVERPRNSDVGGHHLAFFVDDVAEAAAWLARTPGAEVLGEPQLIEDGGPIHGDRWVYFRGVGGFQLEVLNMPPGMPYEQATEARRFGPSPSWGDR
ncbi:MULTISPECIES: VOC family protein [Streptomyces]|uniref:VOC family protein n=1 Tax=Streptomyces TaxID=1883 RepID=UPI000B13594C|nr:MULTISPECIES: VOC family protein [Streptomyces]